MRICLNLFAFKLEFLQLSTLMSPQVLQKKNTKHNFLHLKFDYFCSIKLGFKLASERLYLFEKKTIGGDLKNFLIQIYVCMFRYVLQLCIV